MIPHLSLPFRIEDGAATVNDQDSVEEILACVEAIARCPQGHRIELPEFGVPDETFSQGPADAAPIEAAVNRWEPRASAVAFTDVEATLSRVNVETRAGGSGQ